MVQEDDKRLIELDLPLEKVSAESRREKNIRHGNPSTMHLWWASRPLSASRVAAYASLVPAPSDDDKRKKEKEFVSKLSEWEAVTDIDTLETAKERIHENFDGNTPRLLDPFAGRGSLPLEAQRIGCESHALEFNPVAHILNKCLMEFPQVGEKSTQDAENPFAVDDKEIPVIRALDDWAEAFNQKAQNELDDVYSSDDLGYIWARTLPCQNPNCDLEIPLIKQYWLNSDDDDPEVYYLDCGTDGSVDISIYDSEQIEVFKDGRTKKVRIESEGLEFNPSKGTVRRGSVSCPACGSGFKAKKTRELSKDIGFDYVPLVAIKTTEDTGKDYRIISESDKDRIQNARNQLDNLDNKWIPDEPLPPEGSLGIRVNLYEYENWGELFGVRQKLVLGTLCKVLDELYEKVISNDDENLPEGVGDEEFAKAICTYLALSIDKVADYNSNLTAWHHGRETVGHTYTRGALPVGWDYVEVNPFSGLTGSLESAMNWITRAIETCAYANGEPETVLGNATRLPYPDNHFDGVMTDPPYYDNMPYATIADFFYVWMKRSIGNLFPDVFSTPLSPKGDEIIQDSERHGSEDNAKEFFEGRLSESFSEISRVLKDEDGICTIVFAHKSTTAWAQMIRSVLSSNLVVTATWPIHTEQVNRPRGLESAALASSIYFVCRKQDGEEIGYFDEVRDELEERIHERLDYFWNQGIRGADLIISAIGPAVEVFGQYENVERLSGESVTVDELLEMTQRMVSDYALEKVLSGDINLGNIDPETRFYILYRWAFANQKEDYDEVNKLAQVNGAETSILENAGIMTVSRGDARLQPPQKRSLDDAAEVPDENGLTMVDKIQRAAVLWEEGRRDDLKQFIERYGMSDEFWRAAQAIAECLPENESRSEKEKQMLHGLLQFQSQTDFKPSQGQSYIGDYVDEQEELDETESKEGEENS